MVSSVAKLTILRYSQLITRGVDREIIMMMNYSSTILKHFDWFTMALQSIK
jgi:hypothetical protein